MLLVTESDSRQITDLRNEVSYLKVELETMTHHRTVLQNSLTHLEDLLKKEHHLEDPNVEMYSLSNREGIVNDFNFNMIRRVCMQLQRKNQTLTELVEVYRKGLFSSISQNNSENVANVISSWIETDIGLIRRSYNEDIKSLEIEIEEMHRLYNQSESYRHELRTRLDESLRSFYR